MSSNDRKAVWRRVLGPRVLCGASRHWDPGNTEAGGNTRQGRRQEWQIPKLISPASFNHLHFTVSYTVYQAYPASFAGVFVVGNSSRNS